MQHVGSQFPDQGLSLCPLQSKCRVLPTGPPGKFQKGNCLGGMPKILSRLINENKMKKKSNRKISIFIHVSYHPDCEGLESPHSIHLCVPWWLRWQRIHGQCRRPGFNPWVGKIPWGREWQPKPVFLPGESHGQRSLVRYSPLGLKESDRKLTHFTFQG